MGFGDSCIGLGYCGSGRNGGLPGGLGFPGCPPMSKLRSEPGAILFWREAVDDACGERGGGKKCDRHRL